MRENVGKVKRKRVEKTQMNKKRSAFSGKIGYVLSAAGASVGLGNIWRFPYLAAKYGGGIFLLVYIILALTFGYTMIVAESALGRMTRKSPVGAFRSFAKGKKVGWLSFGGWINAIIPVLIVPYYSVIGGWVVKYLFEYIRGNGSKLAEDGYFSGFISNGGATEICFVIFCMFTLVIIYAGVQNGIERVSKIMMPILIVLSVIIAIYSVTRPGAIEGVKYFLVPNVKNFSWMTVVAAMGQMFYSLSIAMGILVTFGSYMRKDTSIEDSTRNVEIFDTAIAMMAGLMIIPAVFAFSGGDPDTLQAGPSLMFITIPKVFAKHGIRNRSRYPVLRAGAVCSSDKFYRPDRECGIYFRGRTWLGKKESNRTDRCDHDRPGNPVLSGIWSAGCCKDHRHAVFGFL